MRKGFWKQPPLIWDVNPKQIRILNPFFMEIAAERLLSLPMQQLRKIKQVRMRLGTPGGLGTRVGGRGERINRDHDSHRNSTRDSRDPALGRLPVVGFLLARCSQGAHKLENRGASPRWRGVGGYL